MTDETSVFNDRLDSAREFIRVSGDLSTERLTALNRELQAHFLDKPAAEQTREEKFRTVFAVYSCRVFMKAIILHGQNWPDMCVIELYAILEHYTKRLLPDLIDDFRASGHKHPWIDQLTVGAIDRERLAKLAKYGRAIGIWNEDDVDFMDDLKRVRDRFSHKLLEEFAKSWKTPIPETERLEELILFPPERDSERVKSDTDSARKICLAISAFVSLLSAHAIKRVPNGDG